MAEVRDLTEDDREKMDALFKQYFEDKADSTLEAMFTIIDQDSSGFIEKAEMRALMKMQTGRVDEEEVQGQMDIADIDKDGKVSKEEFVNTMKFFFSQF